MQINEFSDISYELDADGIVTVSLNTPKRKNALSGLTALELRWAAKHFQDDDNAQAMILTGAPDPDSAPERQAFSSGGYFVPGIYDNLPAHIVEQIDMSDIAMKATVLEFFSCDKPVLAALNGLAIGGGITLPLAVADQIYLSEHAWARLPFTRQIGSEGKKIHLRKRVAFRIVFADGCAHAFARTTRGGEQRMNRVASR